jgi:serralysin
MGGLSVPNTEPNAVAVAPPNFLDSINWGQALPSGAINVYFADAGERFDGVRSVGWNAYEQQQSMLAFEQFANVCNVSFTIVTDQSQATLTLVNKAQSSSYLGYFNPPGTNGAGIGVMNQSGQGWDEELPGTGGLEQGGYGFITLIHEFGHALGMAHPHDKGGTSTIWQGVKGPFDSLGAFKLNQGIYTTMSYNDGWVKYPGGENTALEYGWQGTMMGFDVAMLQQLYGANMDFATGDDTYEIADANVSGTFFACIWDAGGVDSMTYSGNRNVTIDLRAAHLGYAEGSGGYISFAKGIYGGYTIANGVEIEDASGGGGKDIIIGNDARNTLAGNGGNDAMAGLDGSDNLLGGAGRDVLIGGASGDRLNGGGGADAFVYQSLSDSGLTKDSQDRIIGFNSGSDVIDLRTLDAMTGGTADDAFVYIGNTAFSGAEGQLRWAEAGTGVVVSGDITGDGVADFKILLVGISNLIEADFLM